VTSVPRRFGMLWRALLKSKPRLNLRAHGETPLFYAARLQRLKALDLLIDAGSDPTIGDKKGRDAGPRNAYRNGSTIRTPATSRP
jgi:ankyrin repeat protein